MVEVERCEFVCENGWRGEGREEVEAIGLGPPQAGPAGYGTITRVWTR